MSDHPRADAVIRFCADTFGPVEPHALVEIVPSDVSIAVHTCPADDPDGTVTLFTTGLSDRPMTVPDEPPGLSAYRFAELFVQLPAMWDVRAIRDPALSWPLMWLRTIAKFPHRNDTWLGAPVTVITDDPGVPLGPNVGFDSWLLWAEHAVPVPGGDTVRLYRMFPLYPEERELEAAEGIDALMAAFDQCDFDLTVDPHRPNAARP